MQIEARQSPFDLYFIKDFFDELRCEQVLSAMRIAPSAAATVYRDQPAPVVDARVRRVERITPETAISDLVKQELLRRKDEIGRHFGIVLNDCEEPHFLRYKVGDFFVAHQDGNTGMIRTVQDQFRKVSVSIFLNSEVEAPEPGTYDGGSLVFQRLGVDSYRLRAEAGMLVAFRSETTHEVIPITRGERYAIACWLG